MPTKDDFAMALQTRKKIARTAIRLKASIEADYAINETLGDIEREFAAQAQTGLVQAPSLNELVERLDKDL